MIGQRRRLPSLKTAIRPGIGSPSERRLWNISNACFRGRISSDLRRCRILAAAGVFLTCMIGAAPSWAVETKAKPPSAVAGGPGETISEVAGYQYSSAGKSDPFKPFMETDPVLKKKKEEVLLKKKMVKNKPISPLQQVDIGQLRLVGIAGNDRKRTAIVEDPFAKKHYPLFVGTYIGMNGGRVVSIQSDRLIIEEPLQDQPKKTKKPKVRRISVMLHKEDEGRQ